MDKKFARDAGFNNTVLHGMLVSSLFSTLVGMHCPGKHALILSQEIKYRKPVIPGSELVVRGKVIGKVDSIKVLVIEGLICGRDGTVLIEGIMKVKVMR